MKRPFAIYTGICWVFLVAFFVVLFALLLVPGWLVDMLNASAGLIGLGGNIELGSGDLDHVLSLSLMGCIIVLAGTSAARPRLEEPYWALLCAKAISTLGFTYLAVINGGAWILPAVADGSVIVGLVAARRLGKRRAKRASE